MQGVPARWGDPARGIPTLLDPVYHEPGPPRPLRAGTPLPAGTPPPLLHLFGKGRGQGVPARAVSNCGRFGRGNTTNRVPPTSRDPLPLLRVARLKFSSPLENFKILKFFKLWALREREFFFLFVSAVGEPYSGTPFTCGNLTSIGGSQKGGFQKGGFGGCSPGTKTGTRAHSPRPPFWKPPFYLPMSLFGVDKRVVSKRVVSADVPPERKRFKPERGYVRQNHPFTKPPFYLPVSLGRFSGHPPDFCSKSSLPQVGM